MAGWTGDPLIPVRAGLPGALLPVRRPARAGGGGGGLPPLAPVTDLAATALDHQSIRLDWTDTNDGEAAYSVERKTGEGAWAEVHVTEAGAQTWTDTGLAADTSYDYRLRATLEGRYSAYSNLASAATWIDPLAIGGGPRLWLDGSDLGTLWQNTGGTIPAANVGDPVRRWDDKSGNNYGPVGVAGIPPTVQIDDLSGLTVVRGGGGGGGMTFTGDSLDLFRNIGTAYCFFALNVREAIEPVTGVLFKFAVGPNTNPRARVGHLNGVFRIEARRLDGDSLLSVDGTEPHNGKPRVVTYCFDPANQVMSIRMDGSPHASRSYASAGNTSNTRSNVGYLFRNVNGALYSTANLQELLIYTSALTQEEIEAVEGYLYAKWHMADFVPPQERRVTGALLQTEYRFLPAHRVTSVVAQVEYEIVEE